MNTIQTEIDRLKKAKSDIKTAIINKGGTISDTATIDKYAAAIDGISAGGENKKLKINVVTINPEHLYNDIIFIGYTDSLVNGSLPIVFDFNICRICFDTSMFCFSPKSVKSKIKSFF